MPTDMRLLASVSPRIYSQGTTLDETLVAIPHGATIGPYVSVYLIIAVEIRMAVEIRLTIKSLVNRCEISERKI